MTDPMTPSRVPTCRIGLSVLVVIGFFFETHIVVRDDGSGKLAAVYSATPISTLQSERFRFNSPVTETKHVEIKNGVTAVRVNVKDLTEISQAPELALSSAEFTPIKNGTRTIRAVLRGPQATTAVEGRRPIRVSLTLPGDVVNTTGRQTSSRSVTWSAPIGDYFSEQGIEVEATYKVRSRRELGGQEAADGHAAGSGS
jgi:hypothetical protein